MQRVTRTFNNCEELFEVIIAAHKRHRNAQVYLEKEIAAATNESEGYFMTTKKVKDEYESYLLLSLQIPEQEKITFDVEENTEVVYRFTVDFSHEPDRYQDNYCIKRYSGMY